MSDGYKAKYDMAMAANRILKTNHDRWEARAEHQRKLVKEKLSPQIDSLMQKNLMLQASLKAIVNVADGETINYAFGGELKAARIAMDFGDDRAMEIATLFSDLEIQAKDLLVKVAKSELDIKGEDVVAMVVAHLAGKLRLIQEARDKITGMKYKDPTKAAILKEGRPNEMFRRIDGGKEHKN